MFIVHVAKQNAAPGYSLLSSLLFVDDYFGGHIVSIQGLERFQIPLMG